MITYGNAVPRRRFLGYGVHLPVPTTRCHGAMGPVKGTYILCLAFGEQLAFTGVWLITEAWLVLVNIP